MGSEFMDESMLDEMAPKPGWRWTSNGYPALVSHKSTAYRTPVPKYNKDDYPYRVSYVKRGKAWQCHGQEQWGILPDAHAVINEGAADVLVTVFTSDKVLETSEFDVLPGRLAGLNSSASLSRSWQEGRYVVENSEVILSCKIQKQNKVWMI
jgi:hypothetical protein